MNLIGTKLSDPFCVDFIKSSFSNSHESIYLRRDKLTIVLDAISNSVLYTAMKN